MPCAPSVLITFKTHTTQLSRTAPVTDQSISLQHATGLHLAMLQRQSEAPELDHLHAITAPVGDAAV